MVHERNLIDIREDFLDRIKMGENLVLGLEGAVFFGQQAMDEMIGKSPGHKFIKGGLKVQTRDFRVADMLGALNAHPHIHMELAQGMIVQWWYEFLGEIYRWALMEEANGRRFLPRPTSRKVRGQLQLQMDKPITKSEIEGSVEKFGFLKAVDKLTVLAGLLGVDVSTLDESNLHFQKMHIVLRNVLEHRNGKLEAKDFDHFQDKVFRLMNEGHDDWFEFREGSQIQMTFWEVLRVLRHFFELGDQLIDLIPPSSP